MKSFKQFITEKFYDGVNLGKHYVEIFLNPSKDEYKQVKSNNDSIRGFFLPNGDMLIFNSFNAIHSQVYSRIHIPKDSIPFMTENDHDGGVNIMITDEIVVTKWWDEENDTVIKECVKFIWNDTKWHLLGEDVENITLFNGNL